jgi:hypothetical protein
MRHNRPDGERSSPGRNTDDLVVLGLRPGTAVRFRRRPGDRWQPAVVERVERDGSLGLRDGRGASRAIPLDLVEVAVRGPRGARSWEPAVAVAARTEQLGLF